jgi:hypothetical protein
MITGTKAGRRMVLVMKSVRATPVLRASVAEFALARN